MNLFKTLLSLWTWAAICIVSIVGVTLQSVLTLVTAPFDPTRRISGRFFRLIAVTAIITAPMWRMRRHEPFPRRLRGRTVVISNHVSHLDAFLISHLPWEMKWLAKASLFKVPFLGWGMRWAGDIPVKRTAGKSIGEAMARCAWYLQHEMPVCIFPEGTRSPNDDLLPFKDGAFRLAIENAADILPLAVAGTRHALPKHSWRFNFSRGLVAVGAPIATTGMTVDDVPALKEQARASIMALLNDIRPLARRDIAAAVPEGE